MAQKILIAGYYGFRNTGDETILAALIRDIQTEIPGSRICVISGDPADTQILHHVDAIPWNDIQQIIKEISICNLIIMGGGGLFHDYWGLDKSTILTSRHIGIAFYTSIAMLASIFTKPLMLYSVGVGPLLSEEGKSCVRSIADQASVISVRDQNSKETLLSLGISPSKVVVTADAAFSLKNSNVQKNWKSPGEELLLGVALRNWNFDVDPKYWENEVAAALDAFLEHHPEGRVEFIPFQDNNEELLDDYGIARRIQSIMHHSAHTKISERTTDILENVSRVSQCDIVLGMRLHSLIYAISSSIPLVGLVYDPKVKILLSEILNLGEYSIEISKVNRVDLSQMLDLAYANRNSLHNYLSEASKSLKEEAGRNIELIKGILSHKETPDPALSSMQVQLIQTTLSLAQNLDELTNRSEISSSEQRIEIINLRKELSEKKNQYAEKTRKLIKQLAVNEEKTRKLNKQIAICTEKISSLEQIKLDHQNELDSVSSQLQAINFEKTNEITNISNQLNSIKQSRAWKLILGLWMVRLFFIPHGSRREEFLRSLLHGFRTVRQNPAASMRRLSRHISRKINKTKSPYAISFELFKQERDRKLSIDNHHLNVPETQGLVSIILPVHNGEKYLCEALDSILRQTYTNYEIIAVDDGSTDKTGDILDEYAARDERIRVIHQENCKLPNSLNTGFGYAKGEFLTWTSDDNRLKPEFLQKMMNCLSTHPSWDMVYANMDIMDKTGNPLRDSTWFEGYQTPHGSEHIRLPEVPSELNTYPNNFIGGAFLYRNLVNQFLPGFSPYQFTREDYDYWMQVNSLFCLRHADFKESIYDYRFHSDSLTSKDAELFITRDRKFLMVFDDFRRDFYLMPMVWVISDGDLSKEAQLKARSMFDYLTSHGQIVLTADQFINKTFPHLWMPIIFLKFTENPSEGIDCPETITNIAVKVLIYISDDPLPVVITENWDICFAFRNEQNPPLLRTGTKGWFSSTDVQAIVSAIDIHAKSKQLRRIEQEITQFQSEKLKISVIICTYKRNNGVLKALRAISNQTLSQKEYEVIIIDNNPDDTGLSTSVELIRSKEFSQYPGNLRLFTCPFLGLSYARNAGIAEAQGDILLFLDDDAIANNDILEQYLKAFSEHPDAGVIGGHIRLQKPENLSMTWVNGWEKYWSQFITGYAQYTPVEKWWEFPWGANWCASRKALMQIGGFRTRYGRRGNDFNGGEEIIAASLIQKLGYAIAVLPQAEVLHQVDSTRFTFDNMKHTIRAGIFVHYQAQKDLYFPDETSIHSNYRQIMDTFGKLLQYIRYPNDPYQKAIMTETSFHLSARMQLFIRQIGDQFKFKRIHLRNNSSDPFI
jgi:polysaccharide pyruvyl transferase CsaB